jgi:hypothetical protein
MKSYRAIQRAKRALILPAFAVLLFACTDTPIFYTLEKAYKTEDDRGIDNEAVVERVVFAQSADKYYAQLGSLYQRPGGTAGNWSRVSPPPSGGLCGALEYFEGSPAVERVIAWYYDTLSGDSLGLYKRDPAAVPGNWTQIIDTDVSSGSVRVNFVKEVNNTLFVSTSKYNGSDYTHNLYYSTDAASFDACFATDLDEMVLDVEYDGSRYWVITTPGTPHPKYLYVDGDGDPSTLDFALDGGAPPFSYDSGDPDGTLYAPHSLYYSSTVGNLYLSSWQGRIFIRSGGSWSTWSGDPEIEDDQAVPFTRFVETGDTRIFVGSQAYGYYSFSDGLTAPAASGLSRQPSSPLYEYPPDELYNGAILCFLLDTRGPGQDDDVLFIGTSRAGLWRGDWDAANTRWLWRQE